MQLVFFVHVVAELKGYFLYPTYTLRPPVTEMKKEKHVWSLTWVTTMVPSLYKVVSVHPETGNGLPAGSPEYSNKA